MSQFINHSLFRRNHHAIQYFFLPHAPLIFSVAFFSLVTQFISAFPTIFSFKFPKFFLTLEFFYVNKLLIPRDSAYHDLNCLLLFRA